MLEQYWAKIWYKMLDGIAISHEVSQPSLLKFIEIVNDCFTMYGGELYCTVPVSDHKDTKIDISILPILPNFYKKNKEPTVRQLSYFVQREEKDRIVKCSGNDFKYSNVIPPWNFRHSIWHVNPTLNAVPHHHYTDINDGIINKEGIKCLLENFESCNSILNMTVIKQKDIRAIIGEYEKQHLAMKQNAKKMGKESAKGFLFLILTNFILDFSGRYLMPIMLYHSPEIISKHKDTLLKIGSIIQPLFVMINQLLNYDILLSRLVISVANMTAQYAGINWLPNEFFRFMNIAKLLLTSEIDENVAKEVGFDVAAIFGSSSAKALGCLLSNCLIQKLPKLKNEPEVEDTNLTEGVILNKDEQDQKRADSSNLQRRNKK